MIGYMISVVTSRKSKLRKTGDFDMIYGFLKESWNSIRRVALGVDVLEIHMTTHA